MKRLNKILLSSIFISSLFGEQTINSEIYSNIKDLNNGKLYLEQNNTNLAIASFERVLIYEPNNKEAQTYLNNIINKEEKNYSKRKTKFDLFMKVGASFDNNIENNHNQSDKKIALSTYEALSITPVYHFKENTLINNFAIYNKNIVKYPEKNIQIFSYSPAFTQKYKDINFKHYFDYNYVRYGSESYLDKFILGEQLNFKFVKTHTNITNINFVFNNYIQDTSQNSYELNLNSKVTKHFDNKIQVFINVGTSNVFKQKQNSKNIDYNDNEIGLGTFLPISHYSLMLKGKYNLKSFKDTDINFNKKEIDKKIDYKLSFNNYHYFTYQTEIEYIHNISNIEEYSYKKWIFSINLIKTFKGL